MEFREMARNGIALEPDLPAVLLAPKLIEGADPESLSGMGLLLNTKLLIRLILSERARSRVKPKTELLFPDLDLIYGRVKTPDGRRPLVSSFTVTQARAHLRRLKDDLEGHVASLRKRKKVEQWEILVARLEKHAKRGMTAGEVAALEVE